MHHAAIEQNQTRTETPKRYQCRHIFTDSHRCGSPCLRGEDLCYYHHTTRKPASHPCTRRGRRSTFEIPLPEDRSAVQHSIGLVLQRIAANDIDPGRAGLLLYGLQIASFNLPKPQPTQSETVEETTTHPELGTLAPPAEAGKATERKSSVAHLIEKIMAELPTTRRPIQSEHGSDPEQSCEPATIPTLQATEDPASNGKWVSLRSYLRARLQPCRKRTVRIAAALAAEVRFGQLDPSGNPDPCNLPQPRCTLDPACRAATHLRSLPSAIGATQRPAESSHASLRPPRTFRVIDLPEPQPKKVAALSFSRNTCKERP